LDYEEAAVRRTATDTAPSATKEIAIRTRRRWLFALLVLLLVFEAALYAPFPSLITRARYDRITVGMTKDEVIAILGSPGDYRNAENDYDVSPEHQPAHVFGRGNPAQSWPIIWRSDEADVALSFDASNKVSSGIFCYMRKKSDDPSENMMWRAKRRCMWCLRLGASAIHG
jgi:hypothetical protein